MLSALEANARRLGLDVETVRRDAEALPFADESFDLVFGHAVLHHLPDLDRAFASSDRVLRPGGTLVFAGEPSRYGDRIAAVPKRGAMAVAPLWRRLVGASARHGPSGNGHGPTDDHALEAFVDVHAFDPEQLSRFAIGAGFERRPRARRGAAGQLVRLGQPHARGHRRARRGPVALAPVRLPRLPRRSSRSTAGCSSRGCRRRSSTTSSSAPRSRQQGQAGPPEPRLIRREIVRHATDSTLAPRT